MTRSKKTDKAAQKNTNAPKKSSPLRILSGLTAGGPDQPQVNKSYTSHP